MRICNYLVKKEVYIAKHSNRYLFSKVLTDIFLKDVTDLINRIVQVLKRDLYWVKISIQDAELIKPVKL